MRKGIRYLAVAILASVFCTAAAHSATEAMYAGKTIRIIVGFTPGGGFDIYSRTIGRHLGKHIQGNPNIIVENMPGAGSRVSANHLYKVARPDGLTIGHFIGSLLMDQVLGRRGIEYDAEKFEYIGAPAKDNPVCALTKASGITTIEKWLAAKEPVKLGGSAPGNTTDDYPNILRAAIGLPIHLVSGYKGTADIRLAADSGEVAGGCWTWDSMKATWSGAIEAGNAVVILQMLPRPDPDLPKVPLAINYANTEQARQLIEAGIHDLNLIVRPYVLPPGTPKDRVQIMRKAFIDTFRDPEFLAEAKKSRLDINAVSGEEIERTVAKLFKVPAPILAKLREILEVK